MRVGVGSALDRDDELDRAAHSLSILDIEPDIAGGRRRRWWRRCGVLDVNRNARIGEYVFTHRAPVRGQRMLTIRHASAIPQLHDGPRA